MAEKPEEKPEPPEASSSLPCSSESTSVSLVHGTEGRRERVAVWVNPVPLDGGILCSGEKASSKFSFSHLKKIVTYARNKGKHSYPWLSFSIWHHIAKNKLHLSDETAWLYFETFDTVSDVDISERLKLVNLLSKCPSDEDVDRLHRQVCVDTLKFIVFLYLQNAPRLSLCAPLVTGEEWPSPETDKKLKSSSDHAHLAFVRGHLHEILQLLSNADGMIGMEGVRALEFLLLSSTDKQSHTPLTSLSLQPNEITSNGLLEDGSSFSLPLFETWLRSHLVINPFGSQAMKGGARDKKCPCFRSESYGRVVSNIQLAPKGSHSVLLHGITKQTLAKDQSGLEGASVYIRNCKSSYIYLLGPIKSIVIEKCSRCVLVLGTVERSIIINNCNALCLVTACRRLHMSSTSHSAIHLLTMTPPLLFPSNRDIIFAPYNTYYPQLETHLASAGLSPDINMWDKPHLLSPGSDWSLMDPRNFYSMEVPFVMEGDTKRNPCKLPTVYKEALIQRQRRIAEWQQTVKDARLSQEKQQQLQKIIQDRFREWLEATGHQREIYDLGHDPTAGSNTSTMK
ncbi:PREDICTED: TBCC domain-containing protein 1-like [Amphimedon queenslandica]|uniref:TBCC domain-containing protein 1 n=1 Tax=Amphimedon queenslandica TaxID=400682 RepID=A0A1X7V8C7_AMPQE|nr:PREDICTED: TBCC domain-containing protein 1-like [Amphimedon queenslandica]|eukprot:XP_019850078.1 PREDICTED: TBCC domain-containing protein 1-like [Amphimedon queenslandica]